jgi:hypothetical protein
VVIAASNVVVAFVAPTTARGLVARTSSPLSSTAFHALSAQRNDGAQDDIPNNNNNVVTSGSSWLSGMVLATALWASPVAITAIPSIVHMSPPLGENYAVSVASSPSISSWTSSYISASAKEMASGSGTRVNKDPESLLRWALPIDNKDARDLQKSIEDLRINIQSKRKIAANDDLKKIKGYLKSKESKLTASCRDTAICTELIQSMKEDIEPLEGMLKTSSDSQTGSDQERDALDKSYKTQDRIQAKLSLLQEQMIPLGYVTPVPDVYSDLPQLKGRATVEMILKRPGGEKFNIEGQLFTDAKMKMIIDGYTGKKKKTNNGHVIASCCYYIHTTLATQHTFFLIQTLSFLLTFIIYFIKHP